MYQKLLDSEEPLLENHMASRFILSEVSESVQIRSMPQLDNARFKTMVSGPLVSAGCDLYVAHTKLETSFKYVQSHNEAGEMRDWASLYEPALQALSTCQEQVSKLAAGVGPKLGMTLLKIANRKEQTAATVATDTEVHADEQLPVPTELPKLHTYFSERHPKAEVNNSLVEYMLYGVGRLFCGARFQAETGPSYAPVDVCQAVSWALRTRVKNPSQLRELAALKRQLLDMSAWTVSYCIDLEQDAGNLGCDESYEAGLIAAGLLTAAMAVWACMSWMVRVHGWGGKHEAWLEEDEEKVSYLFMRCRTDHV